MPSITPPEDDTIGPARQLRLDGFGGGGPILTQDDDGTVFVDVRWVSLGQSPETLLALQSWVNRAVEYARMQGVLPDPPPPDEEPF